MKGVLDMNAKELIDFINNVQINKTKIIPGLEAYATKSANYLGVAIDTFSTIEIREKFNKVELVNARMDIDGMTHNVIFLFTREQCMDEHYGTLCLDFLRFENRERISNNPLEWYQEWSELLGNAKRTKMIFDVIGEMKVLTELIKKNYQVNWESINHNTYDISTNNELFEVKTSTKKTETFITIHNQYQLGPVENGILYIIFVRVERNDSGESIDSLYNELVSLGYNLEHVDEYLNEIGYGKGKYERQVKYLVHEIRKYKVDDRFPRITKESFVDDQLLERVVKFEYTISLDGLDYDSL